MKAKFNIFRISLYLFLSIILLNVNGILYLLGMSTGTISPIILVLSIIILLASLKQKSYLLYNMYIAYFLLYLGIGLISLGVSGKMGEKSLQTIIDITTTFIIVSASFFGIKKEICKYGNQIIKYIGWLIIISVLISIFMDITGVTHEIDRYRTDIRLSGIFANPNETSAQALFSIIFIKYLYSTRKNSFFMKTIYLILFILSFYALFLANSRVIIGIAILLFLLNFLFYTKFSLKTLSIYTLLALAMLNVSENIYNNANISLRKRIDNSTTIFEKGITDENSGGRIYLANHALDMIYKNPFIGVGLGKMQKMEDIGGAHNAYLAIWGNAGIVPLLFFLFFISVLLLKLFKQSKYTLDNTFLFLILIIVINGFSKTGVYEFKINNVILGLAIAMLSCPRPLKFRKKNQFRN